MTALARERIVVIMAAMNLNPFSSSFFFSFVICCFVSNFLKFVSNIQKSMIKGVIGPK